MRWLYKARPSSPRRHPPGANRPQLFGLSGRCLAGAEAIEHGVQCLHSLVACRPLIGRIGDK